MTVDDGKPIPHRIRDAIEESDWPELSIREVMDATGLSKDQVLGAAGRGHGLEIDEVTGAVRLLEDDGGEFDDDHGRDLLTDGGVPSGGEGGDSGVTSSTETYRVWCPSCDAEVAGVTEFVAQQLAKHHNEYDYCDSDARYDDTETVQGGGDGR